jgi:pimeloyl-ACP methyl ester carboxylesterase
MMPDFYHGDVRVHFDVAGGDVAGSQGIPILFLHGLGCGARMWWHQTRGFAATNEVIALDFPGHGKSEPAMDCSEAGFAALSVRVLDVLGIDRAVLVGLSMGGGIALATALAHPDRVAGVLAADAGSGSEDPEGARLMALGMARNVREQGIDAFAERMAASPVAGTYAALGPRARRHLVALLRDNDALGVGSVIEGVQASRPPMQARPLHNIAVPTTILVGELDKGCLVPSRHAAGAIPGAQLVVVPGAGHLTALEAPEAFNAALRALLQRVGSG